MILGVDVSYYQDVNATPQKIDFVKMKAAGAKFVYIRVAFGTTKDEDFDYNWQAAKEAGLLRGGYCFWNYWDGAPKMSKQVAFWKSLLEADPGEMPPALDMEQANANFPELPASSVCVDAVWQFSEMCREMIRAAMLYTNLAALFARLKNAPAWMVNQVLLWLAHWYIDPANLKTAPWKRATIWQQGLGKGRGIDFGVESLDVDVDYFMGTEAELYQLAGVTTPAPEPEQPEEEETMGLYSNNARGLFLWEAHKNTDLSALAGKIDFVICYAGQGETQAANFRENIKAARKLGVPVLAYVSLLPDLYQGFSFNPSTFPTGLAEKHVKMLRDALHYDSGLSETIDGIVYDFSDFIMADGKTKNTDNWAAALAEHVTNELFKYFKKPVYPLCKPDFATAFPNPGGAVANLFNSWGGISYVKPTGKVVSDDGINIPADTEGPQPPFISAWDFWWYGTQSLTGLAAAAVLFLFKGNVTALYKALGFTGTPTTPEPEPEPDPVDPDPVDPGTPTDSAAIARIEAKVDEILKYVRDMRNL